MTEKEFGTEEMKDKFGNFLEGFIEEFKVRSIFVTADNGDTIIFCGRGGAGALDHLITTLRILQQLVKDLECETPEILSLIDKLGRLLVSNIKEKRDLNQI